MGNLKTLLSYFIFFLLLGSVFSQDVQLKESFDQQEIILLSLKELMLKGENNTTALKNSLRLKELEMINYENSITIILNQKDSDLLQKENLLKAFRRSSARDQALLTSLSKDIDRFETISKIKDFWRKISISVIVFLVLTVTVETIIIIKKK